jgi:cobalt-zinc-cadmium efflux system outer membrane protein
VSTDVEMLWLTAESRRPSLVSLRQQQAAARGGLFLASRERLPVPALSGGTQVTQDVHGTSAFLGFSIPLPFFDHNQGAVAKATAQIDAANLFVQAGLGEARAEIERAATVLKKRREALQSLEAAVMGRIPTLRRMAEDAYREGSADILELLDANRSLKDFQLARVQQLEAVKLAEETVIGVAGLDAPEPVH